MKKSILVLSILVVVLGRLYVFGEVKNEIQPDNSIFKDTMVEMTWLEVKKAAENGDIVLFPIAVVEEHGPHMDLSPDIYQTYLGCKFIKQELEKKGINSIIAPPYYWGINVATGEFPGSFTVKNETFKAVLVDTIGCLKSWGFTKIFCANLHGDPMHNQVLESSIREIRNDLGIDVYSLQSLNNTIENPPAFPPTRSGKYIPDYHAGADETATMWAFYPDKVKVKIAEKLKPQSWFERLGYVGDPASFKLETSAAESFRTLAKYTALIIETFLKQKKE